MIKVFYVDPMSYSNLGEYDNCLLRELCRTSLLRLRFYCSSKFQYQHQLSYVCGVLPIYHYSDLQSRSAMAFSYFLSGLRLVRDAWICRPNVIHIQWCKVPFIDCFIIFALKLVAGSRHLVITAHNVYPHDASSFDRLSYNLLYRAFTKVIVHESEAMKHLSSIVKNVPIYVIQHGWIYKKDKFETEKYPLNDFGINKARMKIGLLGKSGKYKNYDFVLDVLSNVDNKIDVLLTDRSLYDRWKSKSSRLIFAEDVKSDVRFIEAVDSCDLLILIYTSISQSGLFITATSREVPCIVSNVGGPSVFVAKYGIGEIIREFTREELQHKLGIAIGKLKRYYYRGKFRECSALINDDLSWEKIASETIRAYEDS